MLTLFIYSFALVHFFWIYDYILVNAELVISLSLSIVFFYLYVMLRTSLLFTFFSLMDSIYFIYVLLFILNIITASLSKYYLSNLNLIVKNIFKSIYLFLTILLLNVKMVVWNIYDYFKSLIKTYYIIIDIIFLGIFMNEKKSYILQNFKIKSINDLILKNYVVSLKNILKLNLKKNNKNRNYVS